VLTLDFLQIPDKLFNIMKNLSLILSIVGTLILSCEIRLGILSSYNYEKHYSQLWSLAEKSSTIPAKQQYISQFLNTLKQGKTNGDFAEYDALFLKTPNNNFDANLKALETLSARLTEIQSMDPSSFQYNTAIQQITAQEQGEAGPMLSVFQGCYDLNNYFFIWNWVGGTLVISSLLLIIVFGLVRLMWDLT